MKFKGTIIGEASGSYASNTFSHNRGGQYIRQRAVPTNPNTSFQQAVRAFLALLTSRWQNNLTDGQRSGWNTYAENVQLPDTLGEPRNAGGLGMYCRSNVTRLQASQSILDEAPIVYNLGDYTPPVPGVLSATLQSLSIAFTNTDAWANNDEGGMYVYLSRPFSPTRNYFKGPYRFAEVVLGDGTTPPTSPQLITVPFTVAATQRIGGFIRFGQGDGRLSAPFRFLSVTT